MSAKLDFIIGPLSFPATHLEPPNKTQHDIDEHLSVRVALHTSSNFIGLFL